MLWNRGDNVPPNAARTDFAHPQAVNASIAQALTVPVFAIRLPYSSPGMGARRRRLRKGALVQ
jgi:hypothetical protein